MDTYENQPQQDQPMEQPAASAPQSPPVTPNQPVYPYGYYQYPPVVPAAPEPKEKKGGKAWKVILPIVVAIAIVLTSCVLTAAAVTSYWQTQLTLLNQDFNQKFTELRNDFEDLAYIGKGESVSGTPNTTPDGSLTPAQVYANQVDCVVAIKCTVSSGFSQGTSSGSGFILTSDGYVATNYHVVENARSIKVVDSDGKEYTASYVGGKEANDIAVLKIQATDLQAAVIGRSDHLIVGDQVVAIGNPLGTLASTLTVGYVSAKDRMVATDGTNMNMIQTDAAINPGNSGGPLFNMKGEVVGITSAKYSGLTSSGATIEGIGFAIPMDDVMGMLEDIMGTGTSSNAYMGVTVNDVNALLVYLYGIPYGAMVETTEAGGPAENAGIQAQDVIVAVGEYSVSSVTEFSAALRQYEPGDSVEVKVFRYSAGSEMTMTVTLGQKGGSNTSSDASDTLPENSTSDDWFDRFFGQN